MFHSFRQSLSGSSAPLHSRAKSVLVSRPGVSVAALALLGLSTSVARADLFCYAVKGAVPVSTSKDTTTPFQTATSKSNPYDTDQQAKNVLVFNESASASTNVTAAVAPLLAPAFTTVSSNSWRDQTASLTGAWFSDASALASPTPLTSAATLVSDTSTTDADVSIVVSLESPALQNTIAYFRISTHENDGDVTFRKTINNEGIGADGRVESATKGLVAGMDGRVDKSTIRDVSTALQFGGARYNLNPVSNNYQSDFAIAGVQPVPVTEAYPNFVKDSTFGPGFTTENKSVSRVNNSSNFFQPQDDTQSLYMAYKSGVGITGRILIKPGQRYVSIPLLINNDKILDEFEGELIHFQLLATPDRNGDTIIDTTANGFQGEREFSEQANNVVIQINDDDEVLPTVKANVNPASVDSTIPVEELLFEGATPAPTVAPNTTSSPLIVNERNDRLGAEYKDDGIQPNFAFVGIQVKSPIDPTNSYSLIERPYAVTFDDESLTARSESSKTDPNKLNGYPQFLQDYRSLQTNNLQVVPYGSSTTVKSSFQDIRLKPKQATAVIVLQGDARVEGDDLFNEVAYLNAGFFPESQSDKKYVQPFQIKNDDKVDLRFVSNESTNIVEGDSSADKSIAVNFNIKPVDGGNAVDPVSTEIDIFVGANLQASLDPVKADVGQASIGTKKTLVGKFFADVDYNGVRAFKFSNDDVFDKTANFVCFGDSIVDAHKQEKFRLVVFEADASGQALPKPEHIASEIQRSYTIGDDDVAAFAIGSVKGKEGQSVTAVISSDKRVERTFAFTASVVQLTEGNIASGESVQVAAQVKPTGDVLPTVTPVAKSTFVTDEVAAPGGVAGQFQITLRTDNIFEGDELFGIQAGVSDKVSPESAVFVANPTGLRDSKNEITKASGVVQDASAPSPTPAPAMTVSLSSLSGKDSTIVEGSSGQPTRKTVGTLAFSNPNGTAFSFLLNTATQPKNSPNVASVDGSGGSAQADDYGPTPLFLTPDNQIIESGITATAVAGSPTTYKVTVAKNVVTRANQQIKIGLNVFADTRQDKFDEEEIGLAIRRDPTQPRVALDSKNQVAEAVIADDDTPTLSVDLPLGKDKDSAFQLTEALSRQQVTVGLSTLTASERDLTLKLTVVPAKPTKPEDFETRADLSVTLPANQKLTATNNRAVIRVRNDSFQDTADLEKFSLLVAPTSDLSAGKFNVSKTPFAGTILDDDKVVISLDLRKPNPTLPVDESIGTLNPLVVRSIGSERDLRVTVKTADGTARSVQDKAKGFVRDYVPLAQNVDIKADIKGRKTEEISLTIINDFRQDERDVEDFTVGLSAASGDTAYTIAQQTSVVEIRDNDEIVLDLLRSLTINESAGGKPTPITVQATLFKQPKPQDGIVTERNLAVNLKTLGIGNSDVATARGKAGTATAPYVKDFEPFDAQQAKIVGVLNGVSGQPAQANVTVLNDTVLDERDDETFDIVAFNPNSGSSDYSLGNSKTTVTIKDDEMPNLSLKSGVSGPTLEGRSASFDAILGGVTETERALRVTLLSKAGTNGASLADFKILKAEQFLKAFDNSLSFSVLAVDDTALDAKDIETFAVSLQEVAKQNRLNDLRYEIKVGGGEASGTIEDNDIAVLNLVSVAGAAEVREDASNRKVSYKLRLLFPASSKTGKKAAQTIERSLKIGAKLNVVAESERTTPQQASVLDFENGSALSSTVTNLTMPSGQKETTQSFDIVVKNDTVLDTNVLENYQVIASDLGNTEADDYEFNTATLTGKIRDEDIAKLKIVVEKTAGTSVDTLTEGEVADVKVVLDTSAGVTELERNLSPTLRTAIPATAVQGSDFRAINQSLTIAAFNTATGTQPTETGTQPLITIDDRILEPTENLSLVVDASPNNFAEVSAVVNILDNEKLFLKLSRDDATPLNNLEGVAQSYAVEIDRTARTGQNVAEETAVDISVAYSVDVSGANTAASNDFSPNPTSGSVTIGRNEQKTTFSITPRKDDFQDSLEVESFSVKATSGQASNSGELLVGSSIQDEADDLPTFAIQRVTSSSVTEDSGDVKYQIVLAPGSLNTERKLTINLDTVVTAASGQASSADFTSGLATQTITYDPAVAANLRATFNIGIKDDAVLEDDEDFSLQATKPAGGTADEKDYTLPAAPLAQTIADNEKLFLKLSRDVASTNNTEGVAQTFVIEIDKAARAGENVAEETAVDINVTYSVDVSGTNTAAPTDFAPNATSGRVTITSGLAKATFSITPRKDDFQDSFEVESFGVKATSTQAANSAELVVSSSIQDEADDLPTFSVRKVTGDPITEDSGDVKYQIVLAPGSVNTERASKLDVQAVVTAASGQASSADFENDVLPVQTITYDPAVAANQRATFNISIKNDAIVEGDEGFSVQAAKPAGGTADEKDYLLAGANLPQTIVDNEKLSLKLEPASGTGNINEGTDVTFRLVTTNTAPVTTSRAITIDLAVMAPSTSTKPVSPDDFVGGAFPTKTITIAAGTIAPNTTLTTAPDFLVRALADNKQDSAEIEDFTVSATSTDSFIMGATASGSIQDASGDKPSLRLVRVDASGAEIAPDATLAPGGKAFYQIIAATGGMNKPTERNDNLKVDIKVDFTPGGGTTATSSDFAPPLQKTVTVGSEGTFANRAIFEVQTVASAGASPAKNFVVKASVAAAGTADETDYTFSNDQVITTISAKLSDPAPANPSGGRS